MLNYPVGTLDLVFHALADPTRRGIVDRLSQAPATVSDLAEPLAMSLPAVLQHLRVLETSGIVRTEKRGRTRTCRIEPTALRSLEDWVADRRRCWERDLDRLEALLAEPSPSPSPLPSPRSDR